MYSERLSDLFSRVAAKNNPNREEDFGIIETAIQSIPNYINCVIMSSTRISMAMFRYDDVQRGEVIQEIDAQRRSHHQAMTRSMNLLNSLSQEYGMEQIFPT